MPVKKYKPTSPGRRFMAVSSFEEVTGATPQRSLTVHLKKASGRNNTGRITVRHRGGGHTKLYRIIDFRRSKRDIAGRVAAIEYDPNRSARIALIHYADGEKRYILAPAGPDRRAPSSAPASVPRSSRATPCRSPTSRWAPPSTTSRSSPGGVASWCAAPASPPS